MRGILLGLFALPLAGCSLILDFSGEIADGGPGPDAVMIDADPLAPDAPIDPKVIYEPNNTQAEAYTLAPGAYGPIAIDPMGDHDFFKFTLDAPHDVTVDCLFTTANGDLDMRLYDATMTKIGESAGFMDNEHIVKTMALGNQLGMGDYFIEVYGFNDMRVNDAYMLVLTVQ
jgi:hypothetical protein